jgi:hypothetical protein
MTHEIRNHLGILFIVCSLLYVVLCMYINLLYVLYLCADTSVYASCTDNYIEILM